MPTAYADAISETLELSYEQTVPRSLVHKRALENVLLTEVRDCNEGRFVCAGRIPSAHRFFNDAGRRPQQDILFYTELGRQASLAVSHAFLGVGASDVFIFEGSQAQVRENALKPGFRGATESVITEIRVREIERRRNGVVQRVVADQTMSVAGEEVFQGTGAWNMQPAALFQRLRRMAGPRTAAPRLRNRAATRRASGPNVVITTPQHDSAFTEFHASLIVDETHPYFFDHPCDHVPGMLLLEGAAQLALAATAKVTCLPGGPLAVASYDMNFVQFVETDRPITLTAVVEEPVVTVSISQQNVIAGTATMTIACAF